MIRFLAGAILGAFTGYALATLRAPQVTNPARIRWLGEAEVERRTRPIEPNVVPLTAREQISLRSHFRSHYHNRGAAVIYCDGFGPCEYGDEPLGVG